MKRLYFRLLIFNLLLVIICFACNSPNNESENKVAQFKNDILYLPEKTDILYKDSLYKKEELVNTNNNPKLKISTLLWGECHSCIADLKKWKNFYEFVEKKDNAKILFYLYAPDLEFFRKSLYNKEIHKYPFIVDKKNRYLNKNDLPFKDKVYQTFLLDSNNKVILVGNQIYNDELMKLYKDEIDKRLD